MNAHVASWGGTAAGRQRSLNEFDIGEHGGRMWACQQKHQVLRGMSNEPAKASSDTTMAYGVRTRFYMAHR